MRTFSKKDFYIHLVVHLEKLQRKCVADPARDSDGIETVRQ